MKPKTGTRETGNPAGGEPFYRLRLFVADDEPNSVHARAVLSRLCNEYLRGHCEIYVVDVFKDYQAAIDYQVAAVPTLIVEAPPPPKVIMGSLNDESKVLAALGIAGKESHP